MKIHKLAKYFPVLEGEEFDLLVQDIKEHGQREPIIILGDEILDGVNRYRACQKLGIEPKTKVFRGDDPLAYVVSINIRRRHLTEDQRAMLATEMLPLFEAKAKERIIESNKARAKDDYKPSASNDTDGKFHRASNDAASVFGVSGTRVQRAKRIKEKAPEKVQEIVKGKTTITAIDKEIREKEMAALRAKGQLRQDKKDKKLPAEKPKAVKEFLEGLKVTKTNFIFGIKIAKQGMFSPESKQFVQKQFDQIVELYNNLMEVMK